MGSNETATAITGGPRVIAYLTVTGRHRAQIIYFFWMQIGPRTRSGIGLGSGSRPSEDGNSNGPGMDSLDRRGVRGTATA